MSKYLKNENGYALIIALFTIVFISVIGLGLVSSTISTAKQTNIAEQNYRATHIAEMGVQFTENAMGNYMEQNSTSTLSRNSEAQVKGYVTDMFNHIQTLAQNTTIDNEHPDRKFIIEDIQEEDIKTNEENGQTKVILNVIGKDGNQEQEVKDLSVTLLLKNLVENTETGNGNDDVNWDELFPDEAPEDWVSIVTDFNLENETDPEFDSSVWFNGDVTTKNTPLTVHGDCVINGEFNSGNGHPNIKICGSALFKGEVTDHKGKPGFKGNVDIGNHAIFEEKVYFQNGQSRSYLSGGSTYLKAGAEVGNIPFKIGGDLYIDVENASYEFDKTDMKINGDLIFLNVDKQSKDLKLIGNKFKFLVGGEVKIYYKDGSKARNSDFIRYGISKNNNAKIQFNYNFNRESFEPSCQIDETMNPPEALVPEIEIINVNY